ncbi:Exonuclease V [Pseudocercospora fuligena]|uniref:Exonuclease V n=1 Tax=Pseudocercospora fuligena TaxID=685502 RepID=A0A8H6VL20_9PEZI|nr:Exonuclease V [Pseudocercospora fuligena]
MFARRPQLETFSLHKHIVPIAIRHDGIMALQQPAHDGDDIGDEEDADSDYGSEFDDATWDEAFSQAFSQDALPKIPRVKFEDVEEPILPQQDDSEAQSSHLRLARLRDDLDTAIASNSETSAQLRHIRENLTRAISGVEDTDTQTSRNTRLKRERSVEIEYDEDNRTNFAGVHIGDTPIKRESPSAEDHDPNDSRSPLERFRPAPRKGLSVTDLVSPAWCELQYWYSLNKYGRIKRTPIMKQGSKIHKEKEREIQTEVPVDTVTKEDRLGLRMWNMIQGMRALRLQGITREFDVFGVVDDQVVIGKIDELTYTCPDESEEAKTLGREESESEKKKGKKKMTLLPDQTTMDDFFGASSQDLFNSQDAWSSDAQPKQTVYLVDMKTRKAKGLPKPGSQMRPTQMQLMLYRRLLEDLAMNKVEADRIFDRYQCDGHAMFSDAFIASMGAIDFSSSQRSLDDQNDEFTAGEQDDDPLAEVLAYNTLSSLWSHMIAEFSRTISSNTLSSLLTAKFVASATGEPIGQQCFPFDGKVLDDYVTSTMEWWKGERQARGVDIEEASSKCRICEFAEGCEWRKSEIEEATQKSRLRNAARSRSQI